PMHLRPRRLQFLTFLFALLAGLGVVAVRPGVAQLSRLRCRQFMLQPTGGEAAATVQALQPPPLARTGVDPRARSRPAIARGSFGPAETWEELEADGSRLPEAEFFMGAVYDSLRHRILRFGGHHQYYYYGDFHPWESNLLWSLTTDDSVSWSQVVRDPAPPSLGGVARVLEAAADRLITIGG